MQVKLTTKTEVTVKESFSSEAIIPFDTMVVSKSRYDKLVAQALLMGKSINELLHVNVEKSVWLPGDKAVLRMGDKLVATVTLED